MKQKALNTRQRKFVKLIAQGETQAQAHKKAGFNNTTIEGHGANAIRLLKNERIQEELRKVKEKVTQKTVLSVEAKRKFLHDLVNANPLDPDLPGHLIQEARTEVDPAGNIKKVIKLPSKLEAINIDNKMAGDNYADRAGSEVINPFLAIVSLFSNQPGTLPAMPEMPAPARVIDAEIVP
jgi:hypothetical protein